MRAGIFTDSIHRGSPGLGRYTRNLVEHLLTLDGDFEYLLIHRGDYPYYRDKPHLRVREVITVVGKQLLVPFQLAGQNLDLLHDSYHFPPFLAPSTFRRVMTIADTTPFFLSTHTWRNRLAHRLLVRRLAHRAHHIVTISESSKRDIVRLLDIPAEQVSVTYPAAEEHYRPLEDHERGEEVRARHRLPQRFLLYVGTVEPRKNLARVIAAMETVAQRVPDCSLVLAGPRGWKDGDVLAAARPLEEQGRVVRLGRVPEEDLPVLYGLAEGLVYPSLYEGFGLPVLEAMQCGCPVITSNVSSLPEVAGDAGLLVDPTSVEAIAEAMERVLSSPLQQEAMKLRGIRRARLFSWRRCAEDTVAVYERVLAEAGKLPMRRPVVAPSAETPGRADRPAA